MTKHTPGPWQIGYDYDGSISVDSVNPVRINLTTAGTVVIADICEHKDAEHFSSEANARLIAAAPEMLEALQLCRWHMYEHASNTPDNAFEKLCAAIAKATEGKP